MFKSTTLQHFAFNRSIPTGLGLGYIGITITDND